MVLNNVPNANVPRRAFSSITPFTYPDGITHLEVIERLRSYIGDVLVPWLRERLDAFDESISLNDAIFYELLRDTDSLARAELISIVNSRINGLVPGLISQNVPPIIDNRIADANSPARQTLDNNYVRSGTYSVSGGRPYVEIFNRSEHATLHLTGGEQKRPYIVGIGNDAGSSPGLLVSNKANGVGLYVSNTSTATGTGIFGSQLGAGSNGPFMHLVTTITPTNSPLLRIQSQAGLEANDNQSLLQILNGNGVVATFLRGRTEFHKRVSVNAPDFLVTNSVETPTVERSGTWVTPTGISFKASAGSNSSWFATALRTDGQKLSLMSGGAWGFNPEANYNEVVTITSNSRLSFFGAAPVARQARPAYPDNTTESIANSLNTLIATLLNYGLLREP